MLTEKEIDSLPKGNHSNSKLRAKFGTKHGKVVKGMAKDKDGKVYPVEFIGNRRQYNFSRKTKGFKSPIVHDDEAYKAQPSSSFKPKKGFFGKVGDFIKRAFS